MAADSDLTRLHAHEMAAGLRAGDFSSHELTVAHLDRIEATNRPLNAWVFVDRDEALRQADQADARIAAARSMGVDAVAALPALLGIPVALKDLVLTRGQPATAGSRILEGYLSPYDSHIAERLHEAGAVLLGKTNMDEFAMGSSTEYSAWGPTANPWDLDRVPGGSSGGCGAAAIRRLARAALANRHRYRRLRSASRRRLGRDGLKPTYGRVSRYGIVAFASSLDQIGPFGRDARDAAALLAVLAGRDERDSTSAPIPVPDYAAALPEGDDEAASALKGVRLGLPKQYFVKGMESGVEARVREAVAELAAAGAEIVDVDLAHRLRPGHLLHHRAGRGVGEPRPLRRRALRPFRAPARCRLHRRLPRHPRLWLRCRGQAPDHARNVRPVGRLLRRVLPEGAEGADADQGRLRQGVRASRRDRCADQPDGRFPFGARLQDPVAMYLSDACTLPASTWPACPGCRCRVGCRRGCRSACSSSAAHGTKRSCSSWNRA